MKINPASRRLLPWAGAILLSVTVTLGIIEATRLSLEHDYKEELATEATRRGLEVMAQTMNGNVMGAVSAVGLVDQPIKRVARGEIPLDTPVVMESLQAIGQSYAANGTYIVNPAGIIKSSWDTVGVPLTGVDVKFRPYFQIAMQGKQNIYAAMARQLVCDPCTLPPPCITKYRPMLQLSALWSLASGSNGSTPY